LQLLELARRLDALGDHLQIENGSETQHRFDECGTGAVGLEALHEGAVDLDHVERELMQAREG